MDRLATGFFIKVPVSGPYVDGAAFFQSARSGGGEVAGHGAELLVSLWDCILGAALGACSSGMAHSHFQFKHVIPVSPTKRDNS